MNVNTTVRNLLVIAAAVGLVTVAGCGGNSRPPRFAASGRVSLDGQPLSNAEIVFEPRDSQGLVAVASVANGEFRWTEETGPTAGDFNVRINPLAMDEDEALRMVSSGKRQRLELIAVPVAYQRPGQLEATVSSAGPNEFNFELTSRPKR
ncbi:MAG: hypothetical protein KDA71_12180 [Planctomycetales bacterium]|nr:hypothetical protein [Planctomycetales bacterium]